jgi:hypothetical protein
MSSEPGVHGRDPLHTPGSITEAARIEKLAKICIKKKGISVKKESEYSLKLDLRAVLAYCNFFLKK